MSAKMGRPRVDQPKEIRLSIRLDVELDTKLSKYCEENKLSKGEAIRQGLINLLAESKK